MKNIAMLLICAAALEAQTKKPGGQLAKNEGRHGASGKVGEGEVLPKPVDVPIEPNARGHAAEQLGFGLAVVPGADLPHQLGAVQCNGHPHRFYV